MFAAELKVGLHEKEVETGDTREEEKGSRGNDPFLQSDSKEEGISTVELAHLCE